MAKKYGLSEQTLRLLKNKQKKNEDAKMSRIPDRDKLMSQFVDALQQAFNQVL